MSNDLATPRHHRHDPLPLLLDLGGEFVVVPDIFQYAEHVVHHDGLTGAAALAVVLDLHDRHSTALEAEKALKHCLASGDLVALDELEGLLLAVEHVEPVAWLLDPEIVADDHQPQMTPLVVAPCSVPSGNCSSSRYCHQPIECHLSELDSRDRQCGNHKHDCPRNHNPPQALQEVLDVGILVPVDLGVGWERLSGCDLPLLHTCLAFIHSLEDLERAGWNVHLMDWKQLGDVSDVVVLTAFIAILF